ncbi:MAG: hypothetical protein RIE77_11555 [Phycisphaerales bacterium]
MNWHFRAIPIFASLACVASTCAAGLPETLRFLHQDDAAGAIAEPPPNAGRRVDWNVQIEPMARFTAPAGEIRLPGGSMRGSLVELEDLNLDAPRLMPGFDISLRNGPWRINAIGLFYDIDGQIATADEDLTFGTLSVADGQRTSIAHTYAQIDLRLARTIVDRPISPRTSDEGHRVRFRLDAEAGVRIYDFEFEIENLDTGGRFTDDRTFFEPHAGFKAGFSMFEDLTIDLYTNFGAWPFDASAFSWDIGVGFQWRPVDYFGAQIGYRSTIFRLNEGSGVNEFEWNGSYQGLYAGLQFRF